MTRQAEALKIELPAEIYVTMIGVVPFAHPTPKPVLTPRQAEWIERAWIAQAEGRTGAVELCVSKVERRIWPRGFDPHHERRVAATADARQAARARPLALVVPCAPVELAPDERGLSPQEIERYDRAVAELASIRHPLTAKQKAERQRTIDHIEQSRRAGGEAVALARSQQQTATLAKARGEEVETTKSGGVRVITRDLLLALLRKGKLTANQYDAAVACRDMYEARSSGLGAMEYSDAGRGGSDHEMQIAKGIQRAKALTRIAVIERLVAIQCRDEPACLQMLRAVVGEGMALSSFGEGRAFDRHLGALRRALDVAGEVVRH